MCLCWRFWSRSCLETTLSSQGAEPSLAGFPGNRSLNGHEQGDKRAVVLFPFDVDSCLQPFPVLALKMSLLWQPCRQMCVRARAVDLPAVKGNSLAALASTDSLCFPMTASGLRGAPAHFAGCQGTRRRHGSLLVACWIDGGCTGVTGLQRFYQAAVGSSEGGGSGCLEANSQQSVRLIIYSGSPAEAADTHINSYGMWEGWAGLAGVETTRYQSVPLV